MMEEPREVFISYHTDSAGAAVKKLAAAIENAGITCWYAPRNCGDDWPKSIVEALRSCKVFLLILNKESTMSEHVLNEVNIAFDRFKNHEDISLLPFRIEDCPLSDEFYYYLGRIHILNGTIPPEVQRVQDLIDRISVLVRKKMVRTAALTEEEISAFGLADFLSRVPEASSRPQQKTYQLTGSVIYPDNRFVGRKAELDQMAQCLSGPQNKLFLEGMGGIGKSELAKMYLKQHQAEYDLALWVTFSGSLQQTFADDFAFPISGLTRSDYPEDSDRDYFLRKITVLKQIADQRVLLVVDNYDVSSDPDFDLLAGGRYALIFTTRNHQEHTSVREIVIQEMADEDDLISLFKADYERNLDDRALEDVRKIIRLLHGHTLTVRLVASAMQHRRIRPDKMLALLSAGAAAMAEENSKASDMIYGQLRQVFQMATLSEDEQFLLKNLSLVPLNGIDVQLFYDWTQADDYDVIDDLIRKSWVIHNAATDEVHLHPLLADLFREKLAEDPGACDNYVAALTDAAMHIIDSKAEWKLQLLYLADAAIAAVPKNHPLRWPLMLAAADINMDMCRFDVCQQLYQKLLESAVSLQQRLYIYNKLAHREILSGNPEECTRIALKGIAEGKKTPLDQMDFQAGTSFGNLYLRVMEGSVGTGDFDTALSYGKEALPLAERFYGDSREDSLGWAKFHYGRVLFLSGHLDEGEKCFREAIGLFKEIGNEWATSFCYERLGMIEMKRSHFEQALALVQKGYDILSPQLGDSHRDIAEYFWMRGDILRAKGDSPEAGECYRRAADIFSRLGFTRKEEAVLSDLRMLSY